jgi:hypothetical protein
MPREMPRTDYTWAGWIQWLHLHHLGPGNKRCMDCGMTVKEIVKFDAHFCVGVTDRGVKKRREKVLFET